MHGASKDVGDGTRGTRHRLWALVLALLVISTVAVIANNSDDNAAFERSFSALTGDAASATIAEVLPGDASHSWVAVGSFEKRAGTGSRAYVWISSDGLAWEGGPLSDEVELGKDETLLTSVARHGESFVAVGVDTRRDGRPRPSAWSSTDGRRWERHDIDERSEGSVERVVEAREGFIAFGTDSAATPSGPAIWTSPDGRRWSRAELALPIGTPVSASVSSYGPQGGLLVGRGENDERFVWTSPDGRSWRQTENVTGLPPLKKSRFNSVFWAKDHWVALGFNDGSMAAWTSPNGSSWTAAGFPNGPKGRLLLGTIVDNRLTAIGVNEASELQLYDSSDGGSWTLSQARIPEDLQRRLLPATMAPLVESAGRLVLTATHRGGPGIWMLQDGEWRRVLEGPDIVPDPATTWNGVVEGIAQGPLGYVAVGSQTRISDIAEAENVGAVWTSEDGKDWKPLSEAPDMLQSSALKAVVFARDQYVVLAEHSIWVSSNGSDWQRVLHQGLENQTLEQLEATRFGFVVTGRTSRPGDERSEFVAWASVDGRAWKASPGGDALTPSGEAAVVVNDLCDGADGAVLVGSVTRGGEEHAATWVSADGLQWRNGPVVPDAQKARLGDCVALGREMLVGGSLRSDLGPSATVWRWSGAGPLEPPVALESTQTSGTSTLSFLEPLPDGGIAAVGTRSFLSSTQIAVWVSNGGPMWRSVDRSHNDHPLLNGETPSAAVVGRRLLVGGGAHAAQTRSTGIWVSSPIERLTDAIK